MRARWTALGLTLSRSRATRLSRSWLSAKGTEQDGYRRHHGLLLRGALKERTVDERDLVCLAEVPIVRPLSEAGRHTGDRRQAQGLAAHLAPPAGLAPGARRGGGHCVVHPPGWHIACG